MRINSIILLFLVLSLWSCDNIDQHDDPLLEIISSTQDSIFLHVMDNVEKYQVQIHYTQIDRNADNYPILTSFTYNVDNNRYFYPASTVKMPVAFLALQRINELREKIPEVNKFSRLEYGAGMTPQQVMQIDSSSPSGFPQVAHFVEQIFSVSDNEAYNRLYEFLGQDYINEELKKKGIFNDSRIRTRVGISGFDTEANKYTNPVKILKDNGDILYEQDEYYALNNQFKEISGSIRPIGYYDSALDSVIMEPFDMSAKNFITLQDLEASLQRVIFPEIFEAEERYNLSNADYEFLYDIMPKTPLDFSYHRDHADDYYDSYVKFFWNGDSKEPIPDNIKIFNKVGWAYGTLTDCSYIIDTKNKIEYFISATILVNENQIYNDGKYEYENIGLPYFAQLGKTIYNYELNRKRSNQPDLSKFLN